jgi:hypothetical protein
MKKKRSKSPFSSPFKSPKPAKSPCKSPSREILILQPNWMIRQMILMTYLG